MKCPCCGKEILYRGGDRFKIEGHPGEYMLSQVSGGMVMLIGLTDGNRFSEKPIEVNNMYAIDADVISRLADGDSWEFVSRSWKFCPALENLSEEDDGE